MAGVSIATVEAGGKLYLARSQVHDRLVGALQAYSEFSRACARGYGGPQYAGPSLLAALVRCKVLGKRAPGCCMISLAQAYKACRSAGVPSATLHALRALHAPTLDTVSLSLGCPGSEMPTALDPAPPTLPAQYGLHLHPAAAANPVLKQQTATFKAYCTAPMDSARPGRAMASRTFGDLIKVVRRMLGFFCCLCGVLLPTLASLTDPRLVRTYLSSLMAAGRTRNTCLTVIQHVVKVLSFWRDREGLSPEQATRLARARRWMGQARDAVRKGLPVDRVDMEALPAARPGGRAQ